MQATKHKITHYYQPTANSCGYAALAILLSHYDDSKLTPESLLSAVPQPIDESGKPVGSITAQLATWCLRQGYDLDFYSFDFQITDLSWRGLDAAALIQKLESVEDIRDVAGIGGKEWSKRYVRAYIDLMKTNGNLLIEPHVTSGLLYELLRHGPVFANICSYVTHGVGRQYYPNSTKRTSIPDDINGSVGTHSVVIYGNDEDGNFLVADPWDGLEIVNAETMICGITAASIECDSQCFQLNTPK